jgi:hypothetical protein
MAEVSRSRIDSDQYVARYVLGRLSESEREAFEEFCLLHPDVAEQVATERAFRHGMKVVEMPPQSARPRWPKWALAAGVGAVLAAGIAWLAGGDALHPQRLMVQTGVAGEPAAPVLRLVRVRGSYLPTATLAGEADILRIVIAPGESAGPPPWTAELARNDGDAWRPAGELPGLKANSARELELLVDVSDFGNEHLQLTLRSASGQSEVFGFRLLRDRP